MKSEAIRLDSNLFSILQNESFDNFTITDLRDELREYAEDALLENIRINAYRQVQQLVSAELLIRNGNKYSKNISYKKTEKFYETKFLIKKSDALAFAKPNYPEVSIFNSLRKRLEDSESALFCCIGESEEYQLLSETYPELRTQLITCYKQSQKQTSKLQGQIKALQNLIGDKVHSSSNHGEFA